MQITNSTGNPQRHCHRHVFPPGTPQTGQERIQFIYRSNTRKKMRKLNCSKEKDKRKTRQLRNSKKLFQNSQFLLANVFYQKKDYKKGSTNHQHGYGASKENLKEKISKKQNSCH
jgi:hypothetical protein